MTADAYTLPELEKDIHDTYKWFHRENPFVKPQETGNLGALWALFDIMIAEEQENG